MSWLYNNNNNNQIFQQPSTRYQVYYNEDDPRFRYSQNTTNWSPVRSIYRVKEAVRPSGFRAWCPTPGSRVLGCTLLGSLVLACVIGAIVAGVVTAGKGGSSNGSNTTTTRAPLVTVSSPQEPGTRGPSEGPGSPGTTRGKPGDVTGPTPARNEATTVGSKVTGGSGPVDNTVEPGVSGTGSNPGVTAASNTTKILPDLTSNLPPDSTGPQQTGSRGPQETGPTTPKLSGATDKSATTGNVKVTSGTVGGSVKTTDEVKATQALRSDVTTQVKDLTTTVPPSTTKPPLENCPTEPILIYQRTSLDSMFNRSWSEMRSGFGTNSSDYWRGLDDISALTSTGAFRLFISYDSKDTGTTYPANYDTFTVGAESTGYEMTVSGLWKNFTNDAFQGYTEYKFQTYDRNSGGSGDNCASELGGGWWYPLSGCSCGACLTQKEFTWKGGLNPLLNLQRASMSLICKTV